MGLDISFLYATEDKSRFETPELIGSSLIDLFEAPDVFKYQGLFGGTFESLKEAGFLPSFVEEYRTQMGSEVGWVLERTEEEHEADLATTYEEAFGEDGEDWDNPSVDFTFDASEALEWTELWLGLFETEGFEDPEVLEAVLPYNHRDVNYVKQNLQQLHAQAQEAHDLGVQLRLDALLD